MPHVGDLLAELLIRYEVDCVFGMPGGQTAALYDAIQRRDPQIRHHLVRDERSAGYAADAYARLTGKPGVCDVTVGPGSSKLPDGLLEALNASVPMVAIVGELPRDWAAYRDQGVASQGFDQITYLKSMTKATWAVPSQRALPALVRSAFRTATAGRPGPVALVIPHDVMDEEWDGDEAVLATDSRYIRTPAHRPQASRDSVSDAARVLAGAQRPALVVGGGIHASRAWEQLAALAQRLDAVVLTSLTGKGAVDETADYSGGVLNALGSAAATELVKDADVLMWIGCKVGQNTSLNWTIPSTEQATVHLDIDALELGRTFWPSAALNGDAGETIEALLEHLEQADHPEWREAIASAKAEAEQARDEEMNDDRVPLLPQRVMRELAERLEPDDVVISDASFAAGWIAAYLKALRGGRHYLYARGLGGLGYAVPAAMGAAPARPDARVVTVNGDGGVSFAVGELATHAQRGLRTINVVLNNGSLGWLQMWQHLFFDSRYQSVELQSEKAQPDYGAAGTALGCLGLTVEKPDELADAFDRAFAADGPVVIDIRIELWTTPIHGYRRRLAKGGTFDRPGTVYGELPWNQSPESPVAPS